MNFLRNRSIKPHRFSSRFHQSHTYRYFYSIALMILQSIVDGIYNITTSHPLVPV